MLLQNAYVKIPCTVFPVVTITELTRNSRIFCVATYTGSEGETIATLKVDITLTLTIRTSYLQ